MERQKILEGDLENLPDPTSRTFRVFFSSTFTDMTVERNCLMKEVLPALRDHTRKSGYDFQVVDMRWGVREEAQVEQKTTEYCLKEIEICKRVSVGPYFVAFLGDKYGYCPLPSSIQAWEFKALYRRGASLGLDLSLLDKWYTLDNNAVPPAYAIHPITHHLPQYNDERLEHQQQREEDQAAWQLVRDQLSGLLKRLARVAREAGEIPADSCNKYFASVTEMEVLCGLVGASECPEKVLLYHRQLSNINVQDKLAWRYTDLDDDGNFDTEAQENREALVATKIPSILPNADIIHNSVPWTPRGIDRSVESHDSYLSDFCKSFQTQMEDRINACLSKQSAVSKDDLSGEVLHHLHFGLKKCQNFVGREDVLQSIQEKMMRTKSVEKTDQKEEAADENEDDESIESEENEGVDDVSDPEEKADERKTIMETYKEKLKIPYHFGDEFDDAESDPNRNLMEEFLRLPTDVAAYNQPLIIYGSSGSGKTALMAKIAQKSKTWLPNCICIVRFLGTSPRSSSILEVLRHLCQHILQSYNLTVPHRHDPDLDFQTLTKYFSAILWRIDTSSRPLVILLDSIDQLQADHHAHGLGWLPLQLPPGVHLLLSLLPDHHNCLQNAREILADSNCFVEVPTLTDAAAETMIKTYLRSGCRCLQSAQRKLLLQKFQECAQPLYLKLLIDRALSWRSQDTPEASELGQTVAEAINKFFDKLEHVHGRVLVTKALGYLCAARHGLNDVEMDDVLSLDDEVLQDTYLYHLPPDPLVIRLPPLLWLRIRNDMAEYLVERQSGHVTVVNWYHRQFAEVAAQRYLPTKQKSSIHAVLADLFQGKWSDQVKPLELYKVKKGSFPEAVRQVPSQPLQYGPREFNLRKLYELPLHLVESSAFAEFCETVACSFRWLLAECQAISLSSVLSDLKTALVTMEERGDVTEDVYTDVKYVYSLLLLSSDVVRRDPKHLAAQIVGRLHGRPGLSERVQALLADARAWLAESEQSHLVPKTACAPIPTGLLLNTLAVSTFLAGADRDMGNCMVINESRGELKVVKQVSKKPDSVCIFDLRKDGELIKEEERADHIRYMEVVGGGRYLVEQIYKRMDKWAPVCYMRLTDASTGAIFAFGSKTNSLLVSPSGNLVLYETDGGKSAIARINPDKLTISDVHVLMEEQPGQASCLLFSPDESFAACVIEEKQNQSFGTQLVLRVWSVDSGTLLSNCNLGTSYSSRLLPMSPHRTLAFFTPSNSIVAAYSKDTFQCGFNVYSLPGLELAHSAAFNAEVCAYEPNLVSLDKHGDYFLAGHAGTGIVNGKMAKHTQLHKMETAEAVSTVECVNGPYQDLQLAGKETLYAVLAIVREQTIYVLSFGERKEPVTTAVLLRRLEDHSLWVLQLLISSDESQLVSCGTDNMVKVWDFQEATAPQDFDVEASNPGMTEALVVSNNGCQAFLAMEKGQLLQLDLERVTTRCLVRDQVVISKVLMSRCQSLVMCAASNVIFVIDAKTGDVRRELTPATKRVTCMAEGNKILIAGCAGMSAKGRIWNIETGSVLKDVEFLYSFYDVAMNSTGTKYGVTFFECPFVVSVEAESGFISGEPDSMMTSASCLRISPNDKLLVSCANDGSIRLVTMETNRYYARMQQVSSAVAVAFSPDSRILVTAGFRSVYLWSTQDGHFLYKVTHHSDFVTGLRFVQGCRFLLTWSHDRSMAVWDLENRAPVCTYLTHCSLGGSQVDVTPDLSYVVFAAQRAAPAGVLVPNPTLQTVLEKRYVRELTPALTDAQAVALAFSSQKVAHKTTSSSCVLL